MAALPECADPDDVSITVKASLSADLPIELIELLEKIIIEPPPFSNNQNLQNLLLLTAIRAEKGKVVGYINKLENYDAGEIAKIATDHGLYEEALTIYKKYDQHAMAINVLVEHIVSIDRGFDYANKVNRPEVWSRLAKAQLDGLRIKDSIGTQYFALYLVLNSPRFFLQTRTSRLKIRPTSPKSLKYLIMPGSMTTLFASFKWLANLFGNQESIPSWRMHMPRPIACMTWRTSLA